MITDEKKEYITPEISFERAVEKILNGNKNTVKEKSYEVILTNKKHQETLKKYYLYCKQAGNSRKTMLTKLRILKYFFLFVKKDVSKVKREDIEKFFEYYASKKTSMKFKGKKEQIKLSTLNLIKITVKFFFKWYYKSEDTYPKIVRWIVPTKIKQKDKEILTHEEIKKLITSATMTRDRCLISLLYDGGLRIGEAVNIKLKDITEDSYGFKIKVSGKTGERRIRLTNSVPILRKWINEHPTREDTNSYLFVCLAKQFGMPLGTHGGYKIVEQSAIRAKIQKRIHPHLFRHSRLTHLAEDGFNEMDLRIFAGWSSTSDMPSVYLHNSEKNVEEKILRKEGLFNKTEDKRIEENKKKLRPRECPMCETLNDVGNRFCSKCGQILDVKAIKDIEKTKELVVFTEERKKEMIEELRKELLNELLNKVKQ